MSRIDDPLTATPTGTDFYASLATEFPEVGFTNAVTYSVLPGN